MARRSEGGGEVSILLAFILDGSLAIGASIFMVISVAEALVGRRP